MRRLRHIISGILLLISYPVLAETSTSSDGDSETLSEYLKNLGAYLGFDVTQALQDPIANLLDLSGSTLIQQYSFVTLLGAIPVNAYSDALASFVPSDNSNYAAINKVANYTFTQSNPGAYSSPDVSGGISISTLIDQATYQKDPVTQSILNILATPQATYCMSNDVTSWTSDCSYLYASKIATNVIGTLPNPDTFFTYDYNETVIPQLNSNTLLGPLLYTTTDNAASTSSGDTSNSSTTDDGLTAQNQAQEAGNFVRYATQSVNPQTLALRAEYDALYQTATYDGDDASSLFQKKLAQEQIATYLASLRVYAAQQSLPTANLYAILSKRMPQSQASDSATTTSQALSEFQMATRRLYDPSKQTSSGSNSTNQWIDQINDASSATVQKETAILLAEMNYQMYLSRMQQERVLATLSVMLLQSLSSPTISNGAVDTTAGIAPPTNN